MGSLPTATDEQVDVAIVGGGPTGLLSALLMRSLGTTVSVIDAKSGPLQLGRADALNARTQQYLQVTGILDELREKGIECNTSSTFGDGIFKSRQSTWWTGLQHCLHKHFLMIGQPQIEAALLRHLCEDTMHYDERAVSISEDDYGTTVMTSTGRRIQARYLIGADGARSMVRNSLGISFTGTKPEMIWAVLDTFIETDFPVCSEIITFQLNEQSRVSWIPRERGMARFYVLLDGEVTQGKAEASIREHMAPHKVEFRKTEWFSTFEIKERIASTFISKEGTGRVLLAGDAAHVHAVNGGQGLNTGIADAFALSWRLSTTLNLDKQGISVPASLIRSYDTERRTVAQDVINVAARLVRDTKNTAKQYVGTIEKNAGYITGMGVAYHGIDSALIEESERGIWKAGRRCPDVVLRSKTNDSDVRLYSTIVYGQFAILSVGSGLAKKWPKLPIRLARYSLLPTGQVVDSAAIDGEVSVFESEEAQSDGHFVVVVRPDMYIGYVGSERGAVSYLTQTVLGLEG